MLLMTEVPVQAEAVVPPQADDDIDDFDDNASADSDIADHDDSQLPVDNAPAFEIKPIPPELRQEQSLRDNAAYRKE